MPKTALDSVDSIFRRGECVVFYNVQTRKASTSLEPQTSNKLQSNDPTTQSYSHIPTAKLLLFAAIQSVPYTARGL